MKTRHRAWKARTSAYLLSVSPSLAALTVVGAGLAILQTRERRLSKLEIARLKFYRYLREKGHLES
jgi:hypothetical protein